MFTKILDLIARRSVTIEAIIVSALTLALFLPAVFSDAGYVKAERSGGNYPAWTIQATEVWNEAEAGGWRGVWTPTGSSGEYDAQFTHTNGTRITSKLQMRTDRLNVSIFRWNPGTWGICSYMGTFNGDRSAVSGTYYCTNQAVQWVGPYQWNATITRGPVSGPAGEPLGCFADDTAARDLDGFWFHDGAMSGAMCRNACASRGFTFAATQFSQHCFCGNSYGRYGKSNNCSMPCAGNRSEICGGGYANTVYRAR